MGTKEEEIDGARILERLRLKNLAGVKDLIEDLKKRKSQRSVSTLVEMLQDESWYLREQAVKALADAGPEAREPVLKLLKDGLWYTRAAAAKVLGKIGGPDAVEVLIECLLDSNKTVQGAAAAALVDMVGRRSIEEVASPLASRPQDVKDKAIACLKLLDPEVAERVTAFWEREISRAKVETPPAGWGKSEEADSSAKDGGAS